MSDYFNPYARHGANLENSANRVLTITPSDDDFLDRACKSLRIWNPTTDTAAVRYLTTGGDEATVKVPANSLWTEPCIICKVFETGTTEGLEFHGYTD